MQFIQSICSTLYILINFSKLYHNLFKIIKKSYGLRHSVRAGSNPADWFSSFPPHFCSHYFIWGEKYPAAEKLSSGVKIIRRRNKYPGRARVGQRFDKKVSKKSHSDKSCRTVPKLSYSLS